MSTSAVKDAWWLVKRVVAVGALMCVMTLATCMMCAAIGSSGRDRTSRQPTAREARSAERQWNTDLPSVAQQIANWTKPGARLPRPIEKHAETLFYNLELPEFFEIIMIKRRNNSNAWSITINPRNEHSLSLENFGKGKLLCQSDGKMGYGEYIYRVTEGPLNGTIVRLQHDARRIHQGIVQTYDYISETSSILQNVRDCAQQQ